MEHENAKRQEAPSVPVSAKSDIVCRSLVVQLIIYLPSPFLVRSMKGKRPTRLLKSLIKASSWPPSLSFIASKKSSKVIVVEALKSGFVFSSLAKMESVSYSHLSKSLTLPLKSKPEECF